MKLPFDRARLRERNVLDDEAEIAEAKRMTPSERVELTLALSNLARQLGRAAGGAWLDEDVPLCEKARFYVSPLLAAARR